MRSWSRWVQDTLLPDEFNSRWPDGSQVTCSDEDKPVFRDLCHFLCIFHASEYQIWGPFQSISDFCNKGLCLTISPQDRRQGLAGFYSQTPQLAQFQILSKFVYLQMISAFKHGNRSFSCSCSISLPATRTVLVNFAMCLNTWKAQVSCKEHCFDTNK